MKSLRILPLLALSLTTFAQTTQSPATNWALDRLDQRNGPINGSYSYTTTGAGVHVYILDSGIRADHTEFTGRVTIDADFVSGNPGGFGADCNGHGTAVAGIAAGSTYGVAKSAQIHVLRFTGCTPAADVDAPNLASALDWLVGHHLSPAVVNISYNYSLSGQVRTQITNAITTLLNAGVVIVVSAGNAPGPIGQSWTCDPYYGSCQPAIAPDDNSLTRIPGVIVVGAANYLPAGGFWDRRVQGTHWGTDPSQPTMVWPVDVYAPGWYLLTASNAGPTATQYFSNTSAATPVVTGVVTRYLQTHPTFTPAQIKSWVKWNATFQTLTHIPQPWEAGVVYLSPAE